LEGTFEHDNEPPGSMTDGEFLYYLSDYEFLKRDTAPYSQLVCRVIC